MNFVCISNNLRNAIILWHRLTKRHLCMMFVVCVTLLWKNWSFWQGLVLSGSSSKFVKSYDQATESDWRFKARKEVIENCECTSAIKLKKKLVSFSITKVKQIKFWVMILKPGLIYLSILCNNMSNMYTMFVNFKFQYHSVLCFIVILFGWW